MMDKHNIRIVYLSTYVLLMKTIYVIHIINAPANPRRFQGDFPPPELGK